MQLFRMDAIMLLNKLISFARENFKKHPSKVVHNWPKKKFRHVN
jgi:hypothetical protein